MKWIKKLFGLKENKDQIVEQQTIEPIEEKVEQQQIQPEGKPWKECGHCKQWIYEGEKYSKFPQSPDYYHRKCWKEVLSLAR